jgi:glycerophosphoryl diester phosphodiesterase
MSSSVGPLIAAHRGASKAERENTVAAFRSAVSMGADMIELDVRMTADQQMVVHHDPVIQGVGSICTLAAADLPSYVPKLSESLDACGSLRVNIEIKSDKGEPDYDASHRLTQAVVALLANDARRDRYIVSSFDRSVIDLYRELDPGMATGFLYSISTRPGKLIEACVRDGHVAIHPHHVALTKGTVRDAHEAGLAVNTWTVDDPERMQTLAKWGVSAIITNVPDLAMKALRADAV